MNLLKTINIIILTLLAIGCSSGQEYTFQLLAVDEERAMNVESMSQKDAALVGDIILTAKYDEKQKYLVKSKTIIDNSMIVNAEFSTDELRHGYMITIYFSKEGAEIFSDFTERNTGKRVAIVLNTKVYSAPVIAQKVTGGRVEITGSFSKEEASEIVNSIKSKK